jgi:hypothetical protein
MLPSDAFEAAMTIAEAFEERGVSYAIGGAHAYGQYGIPRATNDVDVNVFVAPDGLTPVFDALRMVGVTVDEAAARAAAERDGLAVLHFGPFRVDLFTPSIAFSWEAERTRVRHVIEGASVWFLSAEALCVFKLLFFRGKDIVDLERLIAVSGDTLDATYVRRWLVDMMGADDQRVVTWDRLWNTHAP